MTLTEQATRDHLIIVMNNFEATARAATASAILARTPAARDASTLVAATARRCINAIDREHYGILRDGDSPWNF